MASNIGRLTVDLRLASQKFEASLKRATANLTTFRNKANTAVKSIGGMQTRIAGLVGVAGFGAMISSSLKAGDSIAKLSDRVGISTESLSALQHMAELNGESIEGLDKSVEKMARSIGEASRGVGTGKKAFEELGISIESLSSLNAEQQFLTIAEAIKGVENKTLQASLASDIFGRSGIKLLNTINQGREGFESAKNEVESLGLALTRVDAAKIEAANDAILNAQKAIKGASMAATIELAPIIEAVSENFVKAGTEGEGFAGKIKKAISGATKFIGVFADGIHGIKVILKLAEVAVKGFGFVWSQVMTFVINDVLVPFANQVTNFVLSPLREVLSFAAEYSETAKSMLNDINKLGAATGFESLNNLSRVIADDFKGSKDELHSLMMETIPSEAMKGKLAEVFSSAQEKAEETAENLQNVFKEASKVDEPVTQEEQESGKQKEKTPEQEISEKRTYLQRISDMEIGHSKKLAAVKKAIKLKEIIQNQFKSISEAVASAPFPANIPAVAFATAESVAALSGFKSAGSFEGGGYTGKGPRVGGIDGRGGIPVTVHPNEMIIDLDKPQSRTQQTFAGGVNNTSNTNISVSNVIQGDTEQIFRALERQPKRLKRIFQTVTYRPM